MAHTVAIIGDGQMGLALAMLLVEGGHRVRLWGPFEADLAELDATRASPRRLPGFRLPDEVEVSPDARRVLDGAEFIVNAIPTQFIRAVWERLAPIVPAAGCLVSVSKGIENETLKRPSEILAELVRPGGDGGATELAVVSGPTIAAELVRRQPATVVAASGSDATATRVQGLLTCAWFRVYAHDDVVGVEVAGAVKNVIALAAGMVDGLGLGYNAKSALLARGLAEITRLGVALGAKQETFFGVAGVGDLATTCFCPDGRNRSCGERLARGEALESIFTTSAGVVEGVPTTKSVVELSGRLSIDMPITDVVHAIIFEGLSPPKAIARLMEREPKAERVG